MIEEPNIYAHIGKRVSLAELNNDPKTTPDKPVFWHNGVLIGVDETFLWLENDPSKKLTGYHRNAIIKVQVI